MSHEEKFLQYVFTFTTAALACAAILIAAPNPDLPDLKSTGYEHQTEEEHGEDGTEIQPQNDNDIKDDKKEIIIGLILPASFDKTLHHYSLL